MQDHTPQTDVEILGTRRRYVGLRILFAGAASWSCHEKRSNRHLINVVLFHSIV